LAVQVRNSSSGTCRWKPRHTWLGRTCGVPRTTQASVSAIAESTRASVRSVTPGSALITREAVFSLTPARSAPSRMVARDLNGWAVTRIASGLEARQFQRCHLLCPQMTSFVNGPTCIRNCFVMGGDVAAWLYRPEAPKTPYHDIGASTPWGILPVIRPGHGRRGGSGGGPSHLRAPALCRDVRLTRRCLVGMEQARLPGLCGSQRLMITTEVHACRHIIAEPARAGPALRCSGPATG
jgi:hypothetical protein